ncbi:MAG: hypothetical protein U0J42_06805 [[Bacteroides] pectinophilus]|jgi:hypothetical protein|nr:hypothetical protein [[Bacteroides] pectinophilus]
MMERLRSLNPVLPDMLLLQTLFLAVGEILIFVIGINVTSIAAGYAGGIIYSMISMYHMASVIDKAVYYEEKGAVARTLGGFFIRVLVLLIMEIVLYYAGGVMAMFASIAAMFTTKVSAYIQPVTNKFLHKIKRKGGKQGDQSNDECSGT